MLDIIINYWWQIVLIAFGAVYFLIGIVRFIKYSKEADKARLELKKVSEKIKNAEGELAGLHKQFSERMKKI